MPEENTTQTIQTAQNPNENQPPEIAPEDQDITPWSSEDDGLADAALGFGLGVLATLIITSIAGIFKR